MYVYLLKHAAEPRFKIGKANDIYRRVPGIGGIETFNIAESFCLQLSSEKNAYRLEKTLHRLFESWRIAVSEGNRYAGDTEQYKIECFDRVLQFLKDNADLTGGVLPLALPPPPVSSSNPVLSTEEVEKLKTEKHLAHINDIERQNKEVLLALKALVGYIEDGKILCGLWTNKADPTESRLFICAAGYDAEWFQSLLEKLIIPTCSGRGMVSLLSGYRYYSNCDGCIGICGVSVLGVNNYPKSVLALWKRIPVFDDADVLVFLRLCRVVDRLERLGINELKDRILRVLLYIHSDQGFFVERGSNGDLSGWIFRYYILGLTEYGLETQEIQQWLDSLRGKVKQELKKMKRAQDPMWGYWIYEKPIELF